MATWTITVTGATGQGDGASGSTALTGGNAPPGDFDGGTITDVSVSGSPTIVSDGTTNDTIGIRFWVENSALTDIYGSNSANAAICSASMGDSVSSATITDDSSPSPAPSTAVAADWDLLAWAINYTNNMAPDGETLTFNGAGVGTFDIVVTYTPGDINITAGAPDDLQLNGTTPTVLYDRYITPGTGALAFDGRSTDGGVDNTTIGSFRSGWGIGLALTGYPPTVSVEAVGGNHDITAGAPDALLFTGNAPTAEIDHFRDTGLGSLTLTGNAPSAEIDHFRDVGADSLEFTLSTPTASIGFVRQIPAPPVDGTIKFTGAAPSAEITHIRDVSVGSLAFSSDAPSVTVNHTVSPSTGSLSFDGRGTTGGVIHTGIDSMGSGWGVGLAFIGYKPEITIASAGTIIPVPVGSISFTGNAPTLNSTIAAGAPDALLFTGNTPSAEIDHYRDVGLASLAFTGNTPTVEIDHFRDVSLGTLSFTGNAPTVAISDNKTVEPTIGSVAFTGYAPTAKIGLLAQPGTGSLTFDGRGTTGGVRQKPIGPTAGWGVGLGFIRYAPTVFVGGKNVNVPTGSLTITTAAPSGEITHIRDVAAASLAFTGYQPEVLTGAGKIISPLKGSISLTGYQPSAEITHNRDVGTGSLSFTGNAPVVNSSLLPATASLAFTGIAPTAEITHIRGIPTGTLTFSSDQLTVNAKFPTTGTLTFNGQAISIDIANSGTAIVNASATNFVPTNYEQCDYTGFRQLPGSLKITWNKYGVRRKSWESRHPQDFQRSEARENVKRKGSKRPEQSDRFIGDEISAVDPEDL